MARSRTSQRRAHAFLAWALFLSSLATISSPIAAQQTQREQFADAWSAAARGDRSVFSRLPAGLETYQLFPYLVYEQLRLERARTRPEEIGIFLDQHEDWAFSRGLRNSWLRTLARQQKWSEFLRYYQPSTNTELRCHKAEAQIRTGQLDGLLTEAQDLWAVGKSQPDECDPVFAWLNRSGGITASLAWQRVYEAIATGNARFTLYLARFIPAHDRVWLERWQDINRSGYRRLNLALNWPDQEITREVVSLSLKRLALSDSGRAWDLFQSLDSHFTWDANQRGSIIRDIALQAAVGLEDQALQILEALPEAHRDDQILQWWARTALAKEEWQTLHEVIGQLPAESKADGRWRYWNAKALEMLGDHAQSGGIMGSLSKEASFYGFLAADELAGPYSICPQAAAVTVESIAALRQRPDISRALELRAAGIENWALSEWVMAVARLDREELRSAAAIAVEEGWHDRAIFALGNSGDSRYYEWRFPVIWEQEVGSESSQNNIDPSWVHGIMRSESALSETVRSSAGAIGLMQVTPATASQLARTHGISYRNSSDLRKAPVNIRLGTRYLRQLLDKYNQNQVLVMGAYNAGPNAVDRWLNSRPQSDAGSWIETIPYYETRDYIPRVLAFTAIYDWRMQRPVTRISSRMPDIDSSIIKQVETTTVVCEAKP